MTSKVFSSIMTEHNNSTEHIICQLDVSRVSIKFEIVFMQGKEDRTSHC